MLVTLGPKQLENREVLFRRRCFSCKKYIYFLDKIFSLCYHVPAMKDYDSITWEDENYWIKVFSMDMGEVVFAEHWIFPDERDRSEHDFQRRLFNALVENRELAEELYDAARERGQWGWAAARVKETLPQVLQDTRVV